MSPAVSPLRTSISPIGGGAEFHRHAHGVVVAHHVDEARVRIAEGAARDLEHVVALVEHDAHRGALVLPQARGLLRETHAAGDLALRTSGEMPATVPMSLRPSSVISAFMPGRISLA